MTGLIDRASHARVKRVSVTDLKNRLSRYLRFVKQGEVVEILERSVPIARIEGIAAGAGRGGEPLERLVEDGIVAPPSTNDARDLLRRPPVPCRGDVAKALIEERRRR